jgi:hypothetical protein
MTPSITPSADRVAALQDLIRAATLAPSSHNTQPWLFHAGPDTLDLLADRTRALPVNDPHDRELTISCGCALLNLRVAAAARGLKAEVTVLPDPGDEDLLATVHLREWAPLADDALLHDAIAARRTCRGPFAEAPPGPEAVRSLAAAAAAEGALLTVIESPARRHAAAALVAEGDAALWADARWRRELAAWMHPRRRGDGLSMPALAVPLAQLVVRTFDLGHGIAARDREVADGSPLLAVLSTEDDRPRQWLAAGQALQRVLLTGVRLGLQASYLNQPVQVPELRVQLQQLTGRGGHAQLLLRIGSPAGALPPASPRRPVPEVLQVV